MDGIASVFGDTFSSSVQRCKDRIRHTSDHCRNADNAVPDGADTCTRTADMDIPAIGLHGNFLSHKGVEVMA